MHESGRGISFAASRSPPSHSRPPSALTHSPHQPIRRRSGGGRARCKAEARSRSVRRLPHCRPLSSGERNRLARRLSSCAGRTRRLLAQRRPTGRSGANSGPRAPDRAGDGRRHRCSFAVRAARRRNQPGRRARRGVSTRLDTDRIGAEYEILTRAPFALVLRVRRPPSIPQRHSRTAGHVAPSIHLWKCDRQRPMTARMSPQSN